MVVDTLYHDLRARCHDEDAIQIAVIRTWQAGARVRDPLKFARQVLWQEVKARARSEQAYRFKLARFQPERSTPGSALRRAEAREQLECLPSDLLRLGLGERPQRPTESVAGYKARVHRLRVKGEKHEVLGNTPSARV